MISILSLITGEGLLSFYPILTRSVNADIVTQTLVRLLTTSIACYPFMTLSLGSIVGQLSTHIVSLLYVFHILTSYLAFLNLDVGVALTLFYTYPIINVLLHQIFYTQIDLKIVSYFLLSFVGACMIAKDSANTTPTTPATSATPTTMPTTGPRSLSLGLVTIILAALSESLIYMFYKDGNGHTESNPFNMLFRMCFSGGIILLLIYWFRANSKEEEVPTEINQQEGNGGHQLQWLTQSPITQLILANLIIGVIGYLLRFYSIPRLSAELYSILSFSGIIFGYLYGWWFYKEQITPAKLIGTLLILLSVYKVKVFTG